MSHLMAKSAHSLTFISLPRRFPSDYRYLATVMFSSDIARSCSMSTSRFSSSLTAFAATPLIMFSFAFSGMPSLIFARAYS